MGKIYARRTDAGFGNRMEVLGEKRVRIGRRYRLPIHYLKPEEVPLLKSNGIDLKFKCVAKYQDYAIFENALGNRMCFRYFDLANILHEEKLA